MQYAIVVQGLSKQYRLGETHRDTMLREVVIRLLRSPWQLWRRQAETIWALKDVSFVAEEGEVIGIIGRNGAGKSTLLKLLSKITYPTLGEIRVRGRVASLLEVGTGFHEELTGRENVYLNGSILGMTKKEMNTRFDDIVGFADIESFIDTPIKRYSSGMRLRLGFAVAAHLDPDILLVDEVLAVGDVEFQKKCLGVMNELRQGGRTVLFVSHNMAAVENLCPRAIWLDGGQVQQDGPSPTVIKAYLSKFASVQQAGFNLRRVESRQGSGEIRYTGVEILDDHGQPKKFVCSGDSLIIRLHYRAEKSLQNPHFGLQLFTQLGTLITSPSTWSAGAEIPLVPAGEGYIDAEISSLYLMPGRYYFTLWASSVGGMNYDKLEYCCMLDVEAADVHGSGRGIESRFGIIFLPCKWRLATGKGTGSI
jgi:lipopolysaccharide transport system ATP-binding protein